MLGFHVPERHRVGNSQILLIGIALWEGSLVVIRGAFTVSEALAGHDLCWVPVSLWFPSATWTHGMCRSICHPDGEAQSKFLGAE